MTLGRNPVMRRVLWALGLGLTLALAACNGAGSKYDEFLPKRLVVLGDEISYVGCVETNGVCLGSHSTLDRFTLNYDTAPGTTLPFFNQWVTVLARLYGLGVDQIVESSYVAQGSTSRRDTRKGATAPVVRAQADGIPPYQKGDLLIIAGGANDIMCVLGKTYPRGGCTSTTLRPGLDPQKMIDAVQAGGLGQDKALRIIAAAHAYQQLALDMIARGHRNIFVVPVYDFSNSPDLNSFCSGCSISDVQTATKLFNIALRAFTDSHGTSLSFSPGEPRILLTTGITSSDDQYVGITRFTTVQGSSVYNFAISPSICGSQASSDFARTSCSWNGSFSSASGTAPIFNGISDATLLAADTKATTFLNVSGRQLYTADFYLSPSAQVTVAGIFYSFMRGFQGW